jgi:large subunit ribosomal protein L6
MSRIGKKPIKLNGSKITVKDNHVEISGSLGTLTIKTIEGISLDISDDTILVNRSDDSKRQRALHGLFRSLLFNAVTGVTVGYAYDLVLQGIGYRVQKVGSNLQFTLGYSHPILFPAPDGVAFEVEGQDKLTIKSHDKQLLGEVRSKIFNLRKRDPYKGKGIYGKEETIRKKQGKSVK